MSAIWRDSEKKKLVRVPQWNDRSKSLSKWIWLPVPHRDLKISEYHPVGMDVIKIETIKETKTYHEHLEQEWLDHQDNINRTSLHANTEHYGFKKGARQTQKYLLPVSFVVEWYKCIQTQHNGVS